MLLLSTSSLKGYGLHKSFLLASKANYDGIDLVVEKGSFDTFDYEYVKKLIEEFKTPVLSVTAPDKGLDKQKVDQVLKIALEVGAQVLNFSPPHITDKNMDWYLEYLNRIKKDNRISITMQNIEQKFLYFVIPEYRNSNLLDIKKVTGDTALNIANIDKASGADLIKMLGVLGNTIKNVYLSDKSGVKDGLIPGSAPGGLSHLPIESFLMKLKSSGYEGFFSLRVKPAELEAGEDEKVLYHLEFVKKYYKKHFLDFNP